MAFPVFASGDVLTATDMNAVGLWLVKTQTIGSGVSTVTVTSAFSATYDNYLITISGGASSASNNRLQLKLGSATTNYQYSFVYIDYGSPTTVVASASNSASIFDFCGSCASTSLSMYCTVQNPFLTENTFVQASVANSAYAGFTSGRLADSTSYTDFTLQPQSGTITGGEIRVYGYRN